MGGRLKSGFSGAARTVARNLAASFLDAWLGGFGDESQAVSPDYLREAARAGRPLMVEGLARLDFGQAATVRGGWGKIALTMTREDYLDILRILEWDQPAAVAVLVEHLEWYAGQMEEARAWLGGSRK